MCNIYDFDYVYIYMISNVCMYLCISKLGHRSVYVYNVYLLDVKQS